jgi:hypothetical protein
MTRRGDLRPASPERMIGRRWRKCRDANPRCPHAGRRLPDLRAEDAGEGPRAPCGRGLRFGTVRGRGQAMISASTPGCVASQAPRQLRIWSSACGSVAAPARSTWSVSPLASLLTNAAPRPEEVAELADEGRVAESDPGPFCTGSRPPWPSLSSPEVRRRRARPCKGVPSSARELDPRSRRFGPPRTDPLRPRWRRDRIVSRGHGQACALADSHSLHYLT